MRRCFIFPAARSIGSPVAVTRPSRATMPSNGCLMAYPFMHVGVTACRAFIFGLSVRGSAREPAYRVDGGAEARGLWVECPRAQLAAQHAVRHSGLPAPRDDRGDIFSRSLHIMFFFSAPPGVLRGEMCCGTILHKRRQLQRVDGSIDAFRSPTYHIPVYELEKVDEEKGWPKPSRDKKQGMRRGRKVVKET